MGIRDLVKSISPPWLIGPGTPSVPLPANAGIAERFMYSIAVGSDLLAQKATEAIQLRFPGYLNPTSLAQIGSDRVIARGIGETDASYAERLRLWLDTWRLAGTAWGVLQAIDAYLPVRARTQSILAGAGYSVWDIIAQGQDPATAPTTHHVTPPNWYWDHLGYIQRRWLVIDHSDGATAWVQPFGNFGGGSTWGTNAGSWGLDALASIAPTLRGLVATWKSASTRYPWIMILIDESWGDWSAAYPDPTTLPDPSWETWSKIDASGARPARVPSRFADARYVDGVLS